MGAALGVAGFEEFLFGAAIDQGFGRVGTEGVE